MPAATAPLSDDILEILGRFKEAARAVNDELRGMERQRKQVEKLGRDVGPEYMQREAQLQERRDYLLKKHDVQQVSTSNADQQHQLSMRIIGKIPGASLVLGKSQQMIGEGGRYLSGYAESAMRTIREMPGTGHSAERLFVAKTQKDIVEEVSHMTEGFPVDPSHTPTRPTTLLGQYTYGLLKSSMLRNMVAIDEGMSANMLGLSTQWNILRTTSKVMGYTAGLAGRAGQWATAQTAGSVFRMAWPGAVAYGAYKWQQAIYERQKASAEQRGSMYGMLNNFENEQRWQSTFSAIEHQQLRNSVIDSSARAAAPQGMYESVKNYLFGNQESAEGLERRSKAERIAMQMAMLQKTTGYKPMTLNEAMGQAEVYKSYGGYSNASWTDLALASNFMTMPLGISRLMQRTTTSEAGWLGTAAYGVRDAWGWAFKKAGLMDKTWHEREMEQKGREYQLATLQSTIKALEDHAKTITENPAYRTTQFAWANYLAATEQDRFMRSQSWNSF